MKSEVDRKEDLTKLIDKLNNIDFNKSCPSKVKDLLGVSFRLLGGGSEGEVYCDKEYPDLVVKIFFSNKEDRVLDLYEKIDYGINLPNTYYTNKRFKIMKNVYSTSLSEMMTNLVSREFIHPTVFEGSGYFTRFNNIDYETKMKGLVDTVVEHAKKGIYLNDLSMSNIHYDLITESFIILDYDMISKSVMEYPRFLEEGCMTVYKQYFIEQLISQKVDTENCLDVFNRVVPVNTPHLVVEGNIKARYSNWFEYLSSTLPNKTRKNVDLLSQYII